MKNNDLMQKANLYLSYKKYRNLLVSLIRLSKKQHYAHFFEEHHSNIKKTWEGIRELINVSKKSSKHINYIIADKRVINDDVGISNSMNNFFVNIGSSIESKIPFAKSHFKSYLKSPNSQSIF